MPLSKAQLSDKIKQALDYEADKDITPSEARKRISDKIADAVEQYVVGRTVLVSGVQPGSGAVNGTIQ